MIYDEIYVYAPDCGVDDIAIASDIADPLGGDGMANAQLIAAAPELLEALQDAIKLANFEGHPYRGWHGKARDAIAKAIGE